MLEFLWRFGARAGPRDGQASDLVAAALETSTIQVAEHEAQDVDVAQSRKMREAILLESVASKLLGAHLDNRHQTSYPLTIDFRSLGPDDGALLLQAMGAAILSDGRSDEARVAGAVARVRALGGTEREAGRLREAVAGHSALSVILPAILRAGLAAHAYAVSLIALPHASGAARLYLHYLAARLGLTPEVTASLNRRYRR